MDLDNIREQIDKIDQELLERLNKRVQLAQQVGHYKLERGMEVYVPSREEEVFGKLTASNSGPLPDKAVRHIYREIISAAIALEKPLKVAYLGPEATYTHQAALKNFGSSIPYDELGPGCFHRGPARGCGLRGGPGGKLHPGDRHQYTGHAG
jgi:chorismate mutase/prephenate dehydratase